MTISGSSDDSIVSGVFSEASFACGGKPPNNEGRRPELFVGFTAPLVTYKPRSSVDVTDLRSVKSTDDVIL